MLETNIARKQLVTVQSAKAYFFWKGKQMLSVLTKVNLETRRRMTTKKLLQNTKKAWRVRTRRKIIAR